jgi:hypothetical protein
MNDAETGFITASVERARREDERLRAAGVRFHSPVTTFPSGIKATYGRDPDGNVFEMLEIPARLA